mgnify:FL=1
MNKLSKNWKKTKLEEIFIFEPKSQLKAGDGNPSGKYVFFTSGQMKNKFIDDYEFEGEYLIFGTGGNAVIHYYNGKFSTSADCFVVSVKKVLTKYVYLYLKSHIQLVQRKFRGAGLKHLSKKRLNEIEIIIPKDLETQNKIIKIIEKVQIGKKLRDETNSLTQHFLKSVFLDMFGDPCINEKKWDTTIIENSLLYIIPQPNHSYSQ